METTQFITLGQQRDILKILNQLKKNIQRTQSLLLNAGRIINQMEINLSDISKEFDDHCDPFQDNVRNQVSTLSSLHLSHFDTESRLKIGERVVWLIRDDEPALGTVKWVGMMSDGLVAGVEFDDPIGNSDGSLDGKVIFSCKSRHARFVLVRELILWKDFAG